MSHDARCKWPPRVAAFLTTAFLLTAGCGQRPDTVERTPSGVTLRLDELTLRISFCGPGAVRVAASPDRTPAPLDSLVIVHCPAPDSLVVVDEHGRLELRTRAMTVSLDRESGALVVFGADGRRLVGAAAPSRSDFQSRTLEDGPAWRVRQQFDLDPDEAVYGLGQFHDGVMNWRGEEVFLAQANTMAAIPYLVSTRGYGLLWNQGSASRFSDGPLGTWFEAEASRGIEYVVVAGDSPLEAIAGYRELTGRAPLFPRWAFGFWQSRERYRTAEELVGAAAEYRRRGLPIDVIVQDWNYWSGDSLFSGMNWDPVRYPDPAGMIRTLHEKLGVRVVVSTWPAVGVKSAVFRDLDKAGLVYARPHWAPARVYDAFSAQARALYWQHAKSGLFDHGIDGWWLDGTEPEFRTTDDRYLTQESTESNASNAAGAPARHLNMYSLMHTGGIAEHLRSAAPDRRPVLLTRSAFLGQQRHSAILWSGDIWSSWGTFRNQIAAGLNVAAAGYPYWTTDIGAFLSAPRFPEGTADPAFRELYVRWFQFGVVSPVFRSHGTNTAREAWQFGEAGSAEYDAIVQALRLRYRLLPTLYSIAHGVHERNEPFIAPLGVVFPEDRSGHAIASSFMVGRTLLAAPVTRPMAHRPDRPQEFIPPRDLLSPDGTSRGMVQEFFGDTDLGRRVTTRRTENFNLTWQGSLPDEVQGSPWSVRYDGRVRIRESGLHVFLVRSDGGARLALDGKILLDRWPLDAERPGSRVDTVTVDLDASDGIPIRLEYRQPVANAAELVMEWIPPGTVPSDTSPWRWPVYLPAGTDWIDFWTGERRPGGRVDTAAAPLMRLPLYVKAGSMLLLGPDVQRADGLPVDPVEIRVYPGADATYEWYEDAGDGNDGGRDRSLVRLHWNDTTRILTIGRRDGTYPGMDLQRLLVAVVVGPGRGTGLTDLSGGTTRIAYLGAETSVRLAD